MRTTKPNSGPCGPICIVFRQYAEQRENSGLIGGGGGIRTHETLSGLTVFKTVAFNRSATPPTLKLS
jgi:hypothetical protein